jgi:hypothetical protein
VTFALAARGAAIACVLVGLGCGAAGASTPTRPAAVEPTLAPVKLDAATTQKLVTALERANAAETGRASSSGEGAPDEHAEAQEVQAMLARVASARQLPIKRPVASRVLDRDAVLARVREHVERDVPLDVVAKQGDALVALELVPPDYDFVAGTFRLLGGRIAGFYEPDDRTMYLVDDLERASADETLAHELVHALQDQSFSLAPMLKFTPGDGDRISAAHALVEGDAMSAMFDVELGSSFRVSIDRLRTLMSASNALSSVAASTPHVLQAALAAPYTDGFALVQQLRLRGGYAEVDRVFRDLPATTEQLLHLDKLDAREPAMKVAVPSVAPLGAGFTAVLDDVMGEQGLRLALEEWVSRPVAEIAAAGWGGDRYVVAERKSADGARRAIAMAWHLRMDTLRDRVQLERVLAERFGRGCRERADLGPIAWRSRGEDIVVVAGPFEREAGGSRSAGSCEGAAKWLTALLAARTRS